MRVIPQILSNSLNLSFKKSMEISMENLFVDIGNERVKTIKPCWRPSLQGSDHSLFLNLRRLPKELQSNLHLPELLKKSPSSIPLGLVAHKASIQCLHFSHSYIPVSNLHDVFVVLQWPTQLIGILLGPRASESHALL